MEHREGFATLNCYEPKHDTPCPEPISCEACKAECDPIFWSASPLTAEDVAKLAAEVRGK